MWLPHEESAAVGLEEVTGAAFAGLVDGFESLAHAARTAPVPRSASVAASFDKLRSGFI